MINVILCFGQLLSVCVHVAHPPMHAWVCSPWIDLSWQTCMNWSHMYISNYCSCVQFICMCMRLLNYLALCMPSFMAWHMYRQLTILYVSAQHCLCVWLVEPSQPPFILVVWKFSLTDNGALSVTIDGAPMMPGLCADNWDTPGA